MLWILVALVWLIALGLTWAAFRRGRLRSPCHLDVAALGLLALATLGFFWRVVVGQNWMPADGGDLVSFLYPTYRFAAATLRDGAWPLWNPHLYGGAPHAGDIQAGFLYPPNLALFLLRPEFPYIALQWLSIGHVWFAGAGMYLLLARGLRVRRTAALAGALAFMFSDAFIVHFGNLNFNAVVSWLPWVFWAYGRKLAAGSWGLERPLANRKPVLSEVEGSQTCPERSRRIASLAQSAICHLPFAVLPGMLLAIATLAGHIQATLFIVLALAIYTTLWLWLHREDPRPARRAAFALVYLSTCLLTTFLLAAPILLPALQLAGHTARAGWSYTETAGYSLAPAQWIGWLIPGFFGRGPQFHWGAWPRVEVGYLGILPLILTGLALVLRRERRTWAWTGLAGTSFLLALGIYAIPHGWLTLLPGFGQLRAPARLVLVTDFALAALAAVGLDAVLQPWTGPAREAFLRYWRLVARATAAALAMGVPLAYLALLLTQDRDPAIVLRVSITLIAVLTFAGLLLASLLWLTARRGDWARPVTLAWLAIALIMLDLASTGAYQDLGDRDPSLSFEQSEIAAYLAAQPGPFRIDARTGIESLWQPDTALLYGLDDVGGLVNPLLLADAGRYWDGLGSRSTRLYDLLNARYVIARKDVALDWDKFALVFDSDPDLNMYQNRDALPRAFMVSQAQTVAGHEAAWTAIHAPGFDPGENAVVEGADVAVGGRGQVVSITAGPGRVRLEVVAEGGPALLIVSQMWYPGWRVWVDGVPYGQPLRVDYAFQGVAFDAGAHQVEMRFDPPLWRLGWLLAAATAGLLVLVGLWRARWALSRRTPDQVTK